MTDFQLEEKLHVLVKKERRITQEILELIREAERRKLYLLRGYPSLYEWLVRGYGFSQAAAYRRVQAAKLLGEMPDVKAKLESGDLNLTTIAQLQSAVRKEEKRGERVSLEKKKALVEEIQGKSPEQTAKVLFQHFPVAVKKVESLRAVSIDQAKLMVVLEEGTVSALKRAKELLSHSCENWSEVIGWLAKDYIKRKDPLLKK